MDNEFANSIKVFADKVTRELEKYYKIFLEARYGFVPKTEELLDFYKSRKIKPTWYNFIDKRKLVVREKGHIVFVMTLTDKISSTRCETHITIDKCVLPRQRRCPCNSWAFKKTRK